jgi:sialidase-1
MMEKSIKRQYVILLLLLWVFTIQRIDAVEIKVTVMKPTIPVLVNKSVNPVLSLCFNENMFGNTKGHINSQRILDLKKIVLSVSGSTDPSDVVSVGIYGADSKGMIDTASVFSEARIECGLAVLRKDIRCLIGQRLWIGVKLKRYADLDHRIVVDCISILSGDGPVKIQKTPVNPLRIGVAVRSHGQNGVNTSRIPGLVTTKKGTLLAIFDARWRSPGDLQGDIDIALTRSTDGGMTWSMMKKVLDMKCYGGLPEKYNGVSDGCILTDANTGDVFVAGLWMYGVLDEKTGKWVEGLTEDSIRHAHQWRDKGSQPGYGVKQTCQFLLAKSTDDGLNWSEPQNLTHLKNENWWLLAPAPGRGITLDDGTLVFPTQGRDEKGTTFSNILWSRDHGKSWIVSKPAFYKSTECAVAQLSDRALMLNMRDGSNKGNGLINGRRVCTTIDLGKTWKEHPTSHRILTEPTCMASLYNHIFNYKEKQKNILFFVNPNSPFYREHITLKISLDDGITWPGKYWVLLDEYRSRGYSCLTAVDNDHIGVLYESSQADLVFEKIKLSDILK